MRDLFSPDLCRQAGGGPRVTEWRHFLSSGASAGLDPGPYFSTRVHKLRSADWAASGARTAPEDFARGLAQKDLRQAHPLIDRAFYRAAYPVRHGDRECHSTSAGFHARCYPDLEQGFPFRNFATRCPTTPPPLAEAAGAESLHWSGTQIAASCPAGQKAGETRAPSFRSPNDGIETDMKGNSFSTSPDEIIRCAKVHSSIQNMKRLESHQRSDARPRCYAGIP